MAKTPVIVLLDTKIIIISFLLALAGIMLIKKK
jgi:hypothetical protein